MYVCVCVCNFLIVTSLQRGKKLDNRAYCQVGVEMSIPDFGGKSKSQKKGIENRKWTESEYHRNGSNGLFQIRHLFVSNNSRLNFFSNYLGNS